MTNATALRALADDLHQDRPEIAHRLRAIAVQVARDEGRLDLIFREALEDERLRTGAEHSGVVVRFPGAAGVWCVR